MRSKDKYQGLFFLVWLVCISASATELTKLCRDDYRLVHGTEQLGVAPGLPTTYHAVEGNRPVTIRSKDGTLKIEFDTDHSLRFEWTAPEKAGPPEQPIYRTPMIDPLYAPKPTSVTRSGNSFVTPKMEVRLSTDGQTIEMIDPATNKLIARISPKDLANPYSNLVIETEVDAAHGFGEFPRAGTTDEPWLGSEAKPEGKYGNAMTQFYGGASSRTQFPMVYGLTKEGKNFGLFLDMPYGIHWDLRNPKAWRAGTYGDQIRGHILIGDSLKDVRKQYLDLTGRPPIPPRSVFGFGISKFGYHNWDEVYRDVEEQRRAGIPVTSVALDLFWFGGSFIDPAGPGPHTTKMGRLAPDPKNFPDFAANVKKLREMGVEIMPITESYVNVDLPEAKFLLTLGCIAKDKEGKPIVLGPDWFGTAYMIDWSNPKSKEWIRYKYGPLAKMGIRQFWFDLGEPEMFAEWAKYQGVEPGKVDHGDIHNLYNLLWTERFKEVMDQEYPRERFYVMNRSGTSGIQRNMAGKWGGDTGATVLSNGDIPELIAHLQNRITNMPMVGIDYYTSDVGGFHRYALNGNEALRNQVYTLWFANSALLDMPFRPHLWIKPQETKFLPTEVGDPASNREAVRLRAELGPYYYSLAYAANKAADPIVAPLVYHFESDPNVRQRMGHQAMIGPNLMMGVAANVHERQRNIYLPAGQWYDFYDNTLHDSPPNGSWLKDVPLYRDAKFKLPLFAREGAIIPIAEPLPKQLSGIDNISLLANPSNLRLRVFSGRQPTHFEMYEDEGRQKQAGAVTRIEQKTDGKSATITVGTRQGTYEGAAAQRPVTIEWVIGNVGVVEAKLSSANDPVKKLPAHPSFAAFNGAKEGYFVDEARHMVYVKTIPLSATEEKKVTLRFR